MLYNYIPEFLLYLNNQRGYSQFTISSYKHDIEQFVEFLKIELPSAIDNIEEITPSVIRSYLAGLRNGGYKPTSLERKIASLRTYFKFLYSKGLIKLNPATYTTIPKKEKRIAGFLDNNQVTQALNLKIENDKYYKRNHLIIELFYASGMRLRELANIKIKDISITQKQMKILGKGNKERFVFFGEPAKISLFDYLNERKNILKDKADNGFLFLSRLGTPLSPRQIEYIVKKYMTKIPGARSNPHTFRHTFATHLLSQGAPLLVIKEMLGHESLKTTQKYTHTELKKLKDTHKKSHPKG